MTAVSIPGMVYLAEQQAHEAWSAYLGTDMPGIISALHTAHAIAGLVEIGAASPLGCGDTVHVSQFEQTNDRLLRHLFEYLCIIGILERHEDSVRATSRGVGLLSETALAQFGFYYEAYGPVTSRISGLLTGMNEYGVDVERDGEALGRHCATLFSRFHTSVMLEALTASSAASILDLGCGGGAFLIDAAIRDPSFSGIGLDISEGAIEFARHAAEKACVDDRVSFVVGDAFVSESWPDECTTVDAISAIGVIHEHFRDGEEAVISILDTYAELMAKRSIGTFILGEPELRYDNLHNDADLYFIHIFTKQGFPRALEDWLDVLNRTRLRCRRVLRRPDAGPRFSFFDLTVRD